MRAVRRLLIGALAFVAAPVAARTPEPTAAWSDRAVSYLLDLCPRVLSGEAKLDDPAAVRRAGLRLAAPSHVSLLWIQARDPRGPMPITIGFNDSPEKRGCRVGFDDPKARFSGALHSALAKRGWASAGSAMPELINFYAPPSPAVTDQIMRVRFERRGKTEASVSLTMIRNKAKAN